MTDKYSFDLTKLTLTDLLTIELARGLSVMGLTIRAVSALSEVIECISGIKVMGLPIAESTACLQAFADALARESESPDGVLRTPLNRKSDDQ